MKLSATCLVPALGLLLLSACAEPEVILPGEREAIREGGDPAPNARLLSAAENAARGISLPPQQSNAAWAQRPGSPSTRVAHAALSSAPQPLWSANIGTGDRKRQRIITDPVVADGRVFTMDSGSVVVATSTAGAQLWSRDMTPERDRSGQAAGGQLAVAGGVLYVSSAYGTLTALDAASGEEIWQQRLGATATGAPLVSGDLVYIVAGDTTAWALETATGRIRWQLDGVSDINNVQGAPAPAVNDSLVLFAYGEGDVQAAFRKGGFQLWNAAVVGERDGFAPATVNDVTADPVISGSQVFVGTHAGRLVALNVDSGAREWTQTMGALAPVWPAGDSIFAVNDLNQLVRLDRSDGSVVWTQNLPGFVPKRRSIRRAAIFQHHGPILAGGALIVASGDGFLRFFDPVSGEPLRQIAVPGGATTAPVVAGGTLYVVSGNGVLHAFR
ncbi:outer membrane protein assembly factor BamB family protein [Pseudaestuariivita sp.]|uniref:outer membrane protein assembly factor BamB family protein n=1 Tax=Pseudaestuariivita sp. TaxID=2211669 RepID=UPI004057DED6